LTASTVTRLVPHRASGTRLYLGNEQELVAEFEVGVPLRGDARETIDALRAMGLNVIIASGDSGSTVGDGWAWELVLMQAWWHGPADRAGGGASQPSDSSSQDTFG